MERTRAVSPETRVYCMWLPGDPFRGTRPRVDEMARERESSFSGGKGTSEHQMWRTQIILNPSETPQEQIIVQLMRSFFYTSDTPHKFGSLTFN